MKQTNSERYQQQKPYKKKTSLAPLSARLLPRLARALKGCFFVQLCRGRKAAPALVWVGFSGGQKIVQNCVLLCNKKSAT